MTTFTLADLQDIVAKRATITDGSSYTASLVEKGLKVATKKLGEEAIETIIAALTEQQRDLVNESADLLYHLLVVWHIAGINLDDVLEVLAERTKQSGLAEKAARLAP